MAKRAPGSSLASREWYQSKDAARQDDEQNLYFLGNHDSSMNPTASGGVQNGSSVEIRTHCMHVFACFGANLHAQSVISNKISASELS